MSDLAIDLGKQLLEAWGIDTSKMAVVGIVLEARPQETPIVTLTCVPTGDVAQVLKQYRLVPA